ncbi:endonuclease [Pseudomonas phage vB_PpuP-Ihaste]
MKPCKIYEGCAPGRYPQERQGGKVVRLHREVCRQHHGEPPFPGAQALHSCDDKRCLEPEHLSWGTAKRNIVEARDRLTIGQQRITLEDARAIRKAGVENARQSAEQYKLSLTQVRKILYGLAWREE